MYFYEPLDTFFKKASVDSLWPGDAIDLCYRALIMACHASTVSHCPNQYWLIGNWNIGNTFQRNLIRNSTFCRPHFPMHFLKWKTFTNKISLKFASNGITDQMSTSVLVMACRLLATSHYLSPYVIHVPRHHMASLGPSELNTSTRRQTN